MIESIYQCENISDFWSWVLISKTKKPMSIKSLSRKLKYSSDRTIGMVIQGKRKISFEIVERLSHYFNFTDKEKLYLLTLARKSRNSDNLNEVALQDNILRKLRPKNTPLIKINSDDLKYMTRWFYFPLIELIKLADHKATPPHLTHYLEGALSLNEVSAALETLEKMRVISKDENGVYHCLEKFYFNTSIDIPSLYIQVAHIDFLKRAIFAIKEQSVLDREFIAKTLTIDKAKLNLFKKRIREFLEELSDELVDETPSSSSAVYQLNLQFFKQGEIKN